MSLKAKYYTINKVKTTFDEWTGDNVITERTAFKGLIQPVTKGIAYVNGKDSQFIPATLKTDIKTEFEAKQLVEDKDGTLYRIANSGGQPKGVAGITPKRGQHAEYSLVYANKGL